MLQNQATTPLSMRTGPVKRRRPKKTSQTRSRKCQYMAQSSTLRRTSPMGAPPKALPLVKASAASPPANADHAGQRSDRKSCSPGLRSGNSRRRSFAARRRADRQERERRSRLPLAGPPPSSRGARGGPRSVPIAAQLLKISTAVFNHKRFGAGKNFTSATFGSGRLVRVT